MPKRWIIAGGTAVMLVAVVVLLVRNVGIEAPPTKVVPALAPPPPATQPVTPVPYSSEAIVQGLPRDIQRKRELESVEKGSPQEIRPVAGGPGAISGLITDEKNQPVSGMQILLEKSEKLVTYRKTATSDALGAFEFNNIALEPYRLTASTEDASAGAMAIFHPMQRQQKVTLILRPTGTLSGEVVDAAENPLAKACVLPKCWKDANGNVSMAMMLQAVGAGITDASGKFQLKGLWHGQWQLMVMTEGYAPYESEFFPVGQHTVRIVLTRKAGTISGQVVDAQTGSPIAGVEVYAGTQSGFFSVGDSGKTDANGQYTIHGLRAGTYSLEVHNSSLAGEPPQVTVAEGTESSAPVLKIHAGAAVSGRVYDAITGKGVAGASVTACPEGGGILQSATTDSEGKYTLTGLKEGPNRVERRETPGYAPGTYGEGKTITIASGKPVADMGFSCSKGGSIHGKAVDGQDQPVEGASVSAWQNGPGLHAVSDQNGAFEFQDLGLTDRVFLSAAKDDLCSEIRGPLMVPANELDDVTLKLLPAASISGVVADDAGRPVANAIVVAEPTDPYVFEDLRARTDSQGRFELVHLAPRGYGLGVKQGAAPKTLPPEVASLMSAAGFTVSDYAEDDLDRPGTLYVQQRFTLKSGDRITGVQLVLGKSNGLSISGRCSFEDGSPIVSASVSAFASNDSQGSAQTDASGNYRIEALAEGEYQMSVHVKDVTLTPPLERRTVAAGTDGADFVFASFGSIAGRVIGKEDGQPVIRFQLSCRHRHTEESMSWSSDSFGRKVESPSGEFQLDQVQPGENTIVVSAPGFAVATSSVSVTSGETTREVTIEVESCAAIHGNVVDEARAPVAGADIVVGSGGGSPIMTNGEGIFELSSYDPHATRILVHRDGFVITDISVDWARAVRDGLTVVLKRGGAVEGHVYREGNPVSGVHVQAMLQGGGSSDVTKSDGSFRIEDLDEGESEISVLSEDFSIENTRVLATSHARIVSGQTTTVDIEIPTASAAIEGTITVEGAPPAHARVVAVRSDAAMNFPETQSADANGNYRMEQMRPGPVQLYVTAQDGKSENIYVKTVELDLLDKQVMRQDFVLTAADATKVPL